MLASLDGKPLTASRALVFMPLEPGRFLLPTETRWDDAVAQVGEVVDGRWKTYETLPALENSRIAVDVTPVRNLNLVVICEKNEAGRWGEHVADLVTMRK